jgi:hypothetical protein
MAVSNPRKKAKKKAPKIAGAGVNTNSKQKKRKA